LVLLLLTARRAAVFTSDLTLWTDATQQAPTLLRPHLNRRKALIGEGRWLEALDECTTVLALVADGKGTTYGRSFAASQCFSR
jgi:hypothetical protein